MTQHIDRWWLIEAYDKYVAETGEDGADLEKIRDTVATSYADAVESGEAERWTPDLVSEGRALFNQFIEPERERRRASVKKSWRHLLDAVNGDTILGGDDPALQLAFPVGDGTDKTLYYWSPENWQAATMARYRNAADVTEAAKQFDREYAQQFIAAMRRRGVKHFGALFAA